MYIYVKEENRNTFQVQRKEGGADCCASVKTLEECNDPPGEGAHGALALLTQRDPRRSARLSPSFSVCSRLPC